MDLNEEVVKDRDNHPMEYDPSITEEKCVEMIDGRVCPSCGGNLQAFLTRDNSANPTFWAACDPCQRFSWGVKPLIFEIAKEMVDHGNYIAYSHLGVKHNHPEAEWPEWYRSQYSGTSSTVQQVFNILKKKLT